MTQPLLRQAYDAYSFTVIPRIGQLVAGDADSYQYLVESIRQFPDQEAFAEMIRAAGFKAVTYENMTHGVVRGGGAGRWRGGAVGRRGATPRQGAGGAREALAAGRGVKWPSCCSLLPS